jgi:hypothetical protein
MGNLKCMLVSLSIAGIVSLTVQAACREAP